MNITPSGVIVLSRRNLLTLIKALDLKVGEPAIRRQVSDNKVVIIKAEEDEQHYASEDRQAPLRGVMGVGPEDVPSPAPRRLRVRISSRSK